MTNLEAKNEISELKAGAKIKFPTATWLMSAANC